MTTPRRSPSANSARSTSSRRATGLPRSESMKLSMSAGVTLTSGATSSLTSPMRPSRTCNATTPSCRVCSGTYTCARKRPSRCSATSTSFAASSRSSRVLSLPMYLVSNVDNSVARFASMPAMRNAVTRNTGPPTSGAVSLRAGTGSAASAASRCACAGVMDFMRLPALGVPVCAALSIGARQTSAIRCRAICPAWRWTELGVCRTFNSTLPDWLRGHSIAAVYRRGEQVVLSRYTARANLSGYPGAGSFHIDAAAPEST